MNLNILNPTRNRSREIERYTRLYTHRPTRMEEQRWKRLEIESSIKETSRKDGDDGLPREREEARDVHGRDEERLMFYVLFLCFLFFFFQLNKIIKIYEMAVLLVKQNQATYLLIWHVTLFPGLVRSALQFDEIISGWKQPEKFPK